MYSVLQSYDHKCICLDATVLNILKKAPIMHTNTHIQTFESLSHTLTSTVGPPSAHWHGSAPKGPGGGGEDRPQGRATDGVCGQDETRLVWTGCHELVSTNVLC